ncbi:MAG: DUF1592 domain-containing protein [Polyangiales bacterium]
MRAPVVTLLVGSIAAGCIGAIGDGSDGTDPGGGSSPVERDPGSKTIHRLNRVEYDNTVRDLLGTSLKPSKDFPADDHGYGFDNMADVMSLSPLQLQLYDRAAEALIEELFADATRLGKVIACDPDADASCARTTLSTFAQRAFRRPASEDDLTKLLSFVEVAKGQGGTAKEGVKLALRAALVSPHFLFRVELDPDLTAKTARALDDYELATRLSYFLWSSMPDDALFAAAAAGKLQNPDELATQALRMLEDPKADALIANFAGQWLHIRDLADVSPESALFPAFDGQLRQSMKTETEKFFGEFLRGDDDVLGLLTADWTYADDRLATFYGLPSPGASGFAKVKLDDRRRGLLGQGTFLTVTSYPNRTSPVKRGRWVLDNFLCTPPPPPPPGIDGLDKSPVKTGTVRERMEAHRKNPVCASCHSMMDPIGFGLETFDAIGSYRTTDNGSTIDASGVLPGSGDTFVGAAELATALAKDPRVPRCVASHLYTYALGRGPTNADEIYLDEITAGAKSKGNRMKDLVLEIVKSEPFRMRTPRVAGGAS